MALLLAAAGAAQDVAVGRVAVVAVVLARECTVYSLVCNALVSTHFTRKRALVGVNAVRACVATVSIILNRQKFFC